MLPELDHVRLLKVLCEKEMCLWGAHTFSWMVNETMGKSVNQKKKWFSIGSIFV